MSVQDLTVIQSEVEESYDVVVNHANSVILKILT